MAPVTGGLVVRYEDDYLAVISKPAGLVVHPSSGVASGTTLTGELAKLWPANAAFDADRAGLVHRLDKDTSGLLLVAKSGSVLAALREAFATREVRKRYAAAVEGTPRETRGIIDAPVRRHMHERHKMAVLPDGKKAVTEYSIRATNGTYSLLDVWITTGRTHQIRVHLSALGTPIAGDVAYGGRPTTPRQMLHALKLELPHPHTGEMLNVTDTLPRDMRDFLNRQGLA